MFNGKFVNNDFDPKHSLLRYILLKWSKLSVDKREKVCYNAHRCERGEMSEWFMELVLKTSDAARHRGFESLSLRQYTWRSTQVAVRGSPAKGVGSAKGREGSNPSFSAIKKVPKCGAFFLCAIRHPTKNPQRAPRAKICRHFTARKAMN